MQTRAIRRMRAAFARRQTRFRTSAPPRLACRSTPLVRAPLTVDSPLPGRDPSMIYDFRGFIGEADINLTGSGTDLNTHATAPYSFHADMRFMKGVFVGTDGQHHKGTFAFI